MEIDLTALSELLKDAFGIPGGPLQRFAPEAHNVHFVAHRSDRSYHVTLRDLADSGDTPGAIENVLAFACRIPGPTGRIVRTLRRSSAGGHLVAFDDFYVSVREHLGETCQKSCEMRRMCDAVTKHGHAIDAISEGHVLLRVGLRYAAPEDSFPMIRTRLEEFVAHYALPGALDVFQSSLRRLESLDGFARSSRLVHGDLAYRNLIDVEGKINVIDHDCLHFDHHLYDLAHLLVSLCSSEYFFGAFSRKRAEQFVAAAIELGAVGVRGELLAASEYVVLKKLALVRQPQNVHAEDRAAAIEVLEGMR